MIARPARRFDATLSPHLEGEAHRGAQDSGHRGRRAKPDRSRRPMPPVTTTGTDKRGEDGHLEEHERDRVERFASRPPTPRSTPRTRRRSRASSRVAEATLDCGGEQEEADGRHRDGDDHRPGSGTATPMQVFVSTMGVNTTKSPVMNARLRCAVVCCKPTFWNQYPTHPIAPNTIPALTNEPRLRPWARLPARGCATRYERKRPQHDPRDASKRSSMLADRRDVDQRFAPASNVARPDRRRDQCELGEQRAAASPTPPACASPLAQCFGRGISRASDW